MSPTGRGSHLRSPGWGDGWPQSERVLPQRFSATLIRDASGSGKYRPMRLSPPRRYTSSRPPVTTMRTRSPWVSKKPLEEGLPASVLLWIPSNTATGSDARRRERPSDFPQQQKAPGGESLRWSWIVPVEVCLTKLPARRRLTDLTRSGDGEGHLAVESQVVREDRVVEAGSVHGRPPGTKNAPVVKRFGPFYNVAYEWSSRFSFGSPGGGGGPST